MIGTDRSYEHRSYAIGRAHLADVLPPDAHKAWSALTFFGWREPVKVAAVALVGFGLLYLIFCIGVAL